MASKKTDLDLITSLFKQRPGQNLVYVKKNRGSRDHLFQGTERVFVKGWGSWAVLSSLKNGSLSRPSPRPRPIPSFRRLSIHPDRSTRERVLVRPEDRSGAGYFEMQDFRGRSSYKPDGRMRRATCGLHRQAPPRRASPTHRQVPPRRGAARK